MRVIKPCAKLVWITPSPEKTIEQIGRTCYKSEDKITEDSAGKFCRMLIRRGHEAMIEHASASFRFITDRGISHEIVRHRIASYAQESTRYCNYSKDKFQGITMIRPSGIFEDDRAWIEACEKAEAEYLNLIQRGAKPEMARSVLPTCLKTEIVMTANLREWRHFIKMRLDSPAHPDVRVLAYQVFKRLNTLAPSVFADLEIFAIDYLRQQEPDE